MVTFGDVKNRVESMHLLQGTDALDQQYAAEITTCIQNTRNATSVQCSKCTEHSNGGVHPQLNLPSDVSKVMYDNVEDYEKAMQIDTIIHGLFPSNGAQIREDNKNLLIRKIGKYSEFIHSDPGVLLTILQSTGKISKIIVTVHIPPPSSLACER